MPRTNTLSIWLLSLFALFLGSLGPPVHAVSSIEVDLFYEADTDTLRLDKYSPNPIKTENTQGIYMNPPDSGYRDPEGKYNVALYSEGEDPVTEFRISPPDRVFTLPIPKLPAVTRFEIINVSTGEVVLDYKLEKGSLCNKNDTCEFENGENKFTCYSDCTQNGQNGEPVRFSEQTKEELQRQNGILRNEEGTVLLEANDASADTQRSNNNSSNSSSSSNMWILIGGLFLIGSAATVWMYLTFFKNEE